MREHLSSLISQALDKLLKSLDAGHTAKPKIQLDHSKNPAHGEFSSNIAMQLAGSLKTPSRKIAQKLVKFIPVDDSITKVEIAGPGFINFFINANIQTQIIETILRQKEKFGLQPETGGEICLEFVSANPTGPLHVGHGRGAAFGASLANILRAAGFAVTTEYYINDAGRQMDILTVSVWLRYLDLAGISAEFPANGYQGDYIWDIAAYIRQEMSDKFTIDASALYHNIRPDESQGGDKEQHIDDLIAKARTHLQQNYQYILLTALKAILSNIRHDLEQFRVKYDNWFSELSLADNEEIDQTLHKLEAKKYIYEKHGAKWFKSNKHGDEKDRVVVRENGLKTYFASDIAYHKHKLNRGFDTLINIWGADHHGYIPRMRASITALGYKPEKLQIILVQFANLYRAGKKIPMSTRSGSFVTLRELYDEVGVDATRFFYIMRKSDQHLDFDLDLAKSQSTDNPVYYIQYAHARVQSVMSRLQEQKLDFDIDSGLANLKLLESAKEQALIKRLHQFEDTLVKAAHNFSPHYLAFYLQELAHEYHTYYNSHKFIIEDSALRNARLCLINAVGIIIKNTLSLIGVSAPNKM